MSQMLLLNTVVFPTDNDIRDQQRLQMFAVQFKMDQRRLFREYNEMVTTVNRMIRLNWGMTNSSAEVRIHTSHDDTTVAKHELMLHCILRHLQTNGFLAEIVAQTLLRDPSFVLRLTLPSDP